MKPFEGFRKSGTFGVAPGTEVQGDLILKGLQTTLDLFSKDFFNTRSLQDGCILGALHDRTKVSLIDCITTQGWAVDREAMSTITSLAFFRIS